MGVLHRVLPTFPLFLILACQQDTPVRLTSIDEQGLHFSSGEIHRLAADTGQVLLFLLAYAPSDPPGRLTIQGERMVDLLSPAGLTGIHVLDRPSAMEVVRPLADATSLAVHPFAYWDADRVIDSLLNQTGGPPHVMITSLFVREELLKDRFSMDNRHWTGQQPDEVVILVLRPGLGAQIMKFPY